jgi:nucleotide-binding universal stress UspA family protein
MGRFPATPSSHEAAGHTDAIPGHCSRGVLRGQEPTINSTSVIRRCSRFIALNQLAIENAYRHQCFEGLADATKPGPGAFLCHTLSHAESDPGMFRMATVFNLEEHSSSGCSSRRFPMSRCGSGKLEIVLMVIQAPEISATRVLLSVASPRLLPAATAFIATAVGKGAEIQIVEPDALAELSIAAKHERPVMIVIAGYSSGDELPNGGIDPAWIALESPVPVMFLRGRVGDPVTCSTTKRILVPLDGSSRSAQVSPIAAGIARTTGVPVHLVMVIDPSRVLPPAYAYDPAPWDVIVGLRESAHWALRQAEEPLMREGICVESSLLYGPVNTVLQSAMAPGDMVIMRTRGIGMARRNAESVTRGVLATATGPVIIHPGSDHGDIVVDGYEACSWVEPLSRQPAMYRR